ncbi:CarD family transcriptional regulator [Luteococcus sp. OSA5]|uniref:CarD family transcriptional regulator n=1 Tax=Luteococcus sp. OSA5 TaxID=3401630 RepID=UPI003B43D4E6
MHFEPGQIVVHPHHGPATVTGIVTRAVRRNNRKYLELETHDQRLQISIPLDGADEIGLRNLLCANDRAKLLEVLAAPTTHVEKGWSRRIKAHQQKVRSGDLALIAEVVRDLTRRQQDSGISLGERELLREAMTPLVEELSICVDADEETVTKALNDCILTGVIPAVQTPELAVAS